MPNLTMGREGTRFYGDGVNLAWPKGGKREVVKPPAVLSARIKRRIAEGVLVQTDAKANKAPYVEPQSRILTGDAARAFRAPKAAEATAEVSVEPVVGASAAVEPAEVATLEAPAEPPSAPAEEDATEPAPTREGESSQEGRTRKPRAEVVPSQGEDS